MTEIMSEIKRDHMLKLIHDKFLQLGLGRTETLITFKEVFKRQIPIKKPSAKK